MYPSAANVYLPAQGRRLLAFSDSRQEAARLGPRLTAQHDEQIIRRVDGEAKAVVSKSKRRFPNRQWGASGWYDSCRGASVADRE